MGYVQLSGFPATESVQDEDQFYADNATTGVEQRTTAKQFGNYVMGGFAPQRQSIPVTSAGQASYVTGGYTPGLINVFIGGLRLNPPQYQAIDGIHIVIIDATVLTNLVPPMTVDIDASLSINSGEYATPASVQALDPANQPQIGALAGTEIVLTRQGQGLFQTSFNRLATFINGQVNPTNLPVAATLTGAELQPVSQGGSLFQTSLTKIAQWVIGAFQGLTRSATGAVSRTINSRFQEEWRLTDFGAVPNSGADALPAFNAAIAAVQAIAAAQGFVYPVPAIVIPAGTYKLSATVNTYPWVKLKTLGSVVLDFTGIAVGTNGIVCRNQQTAIPSGALNWGTHSPFLDGSAGSLMLLGPGKLVSTGSAIVMGNTTTASNPVRDTGGVNVIAEQWGNALEFDPINVYLSKWKGCRFEQNGNASIICNPASGSQINSGERMLFEDCVFSGAQYGLYQNCDGFDYNFVSCSFDYNGTPFFYGPNGRYSTVRLIAGHTEAFDGKFFDATTSGQYVNLIIEGHDILPTAWVSGLPCSPSRVLIDGNPASNMRLSVDGLTLEYTVQPYTPNSSAVGNNVYIASMSGVIYQAFYAPFSLLKTLGRDYDFSLNTVGTVASALSAWFIDTTSFTEVSIGAADIQAAPTLTGSQALHLNGTDAVNTQITIGSIDLAPCAPGETFYPGCDFYGGTATGALNVRVFLRYYDAIGNFLSDSNTWFTYSMATAYANASVPGSGTTAQWFATNHIVTTAPVKAAFFRTYVKVSAFSGDVYVRNVRAAFVTNRSSGSGMPSVTTAIGSIPYANGTGMLSTDRSNLFYDSVNKRIGIGTSSPLAPVNALVVSNGAAVTVSRFENYSATAGGGVYSDYNAYNSFGAVGVRQYVYSPAGTSLHRYRIYVNGGSGLVTAAEFSADSSLPGMVAGGVGPATSTLQSAGTFALPIPVYKLNLTYPTSNTDFCVLGDGTSIAQLPSPAACPGRLYAVKNYGTGTTTIKRNLTTDTIDGVVSDLVITTQYTTYLLQSNGVAGWYVIAAYNSAATTGTGLRVKESANGKQGIATLVAGTVVVANTSITANSRILYSVQTAGGTQGFLSTSRVVGTSFTITSTSSTETSTVAYEIFEPG